MTYIVSKKRLTKADLENLVKEIEAQGHYYCEELCSAALAAHVASEAYLLMAERQLLRETLKEAAESNQLSLPWQVKVAQILEKVPNATD